MKVLNIPIYSEAIGLTDENIENDKEEMIVVNVAETKGICHGTMTDLFNQDVIEKYKLPAINSKFAGGAIVVFEDDINISQWKYGFSDLGKRFIETVARFLQEEGLNAIVDNNDVIIREDDMNYKVCSYASTWLNGEEGVYTVLHVSMGMDVDLIKEICNKPMEKTPKGLHDYGISSEDVLEYIKDNMDDFKDLEI